MSHTETKDDKDDTLETIRKRYKGSIHSLLIELQEKYEEHEKDPPEWLAYAENLPCMRVLRSQVPNHKRRRANDGRMLAASPTTLTQKTISSREKDYAAVSYTWAAPEHQSASIGRYQCIPVGENFERTCPIRDQIMDRVIAFVDYQEKCKLFWIDQICLDQNDENEKQKALQAMHQIYRNSNYPIALLSTSIDTRDELKLLSQLLLGDADEADSEMFKLIKRLTLDTWFQRAWTYHEDYFSVYRMALLIPHKPHLNELKKKINGKTAPAHLFGDLPDELCIESVTFREEVTKFCMGYRTSPALQPDERTACQRVLHVAAKYTELLGRRHESMSSYIFTDIAERGISKLSDRCAIAANCLDYRTMIHPKAFEFEERNSPSLIMLALYLVNGEILWNNRTIKDTSRLTVFEFLKEYSFKNFKPPRAAYKLTYNKSCRFVDPRLTDCGVEVSGHLWRLSKRIGPEDYALSWDIPEGRSLEDLADLLGSEYLGRRYPLADEIVDFLSKQKEEEETFSMWYKKTMARVIEDAMKDGKSFRLACIVDEDDSDASYRGIFVDDFPEDTGEAYVFTSFSEGGRSWKDIHKHVSMEVDLEDDEVDSEDDEVTEMTPSLFTRRWRNGLIFFTDERTRSFVFPWPDGLTI